MDELHMIGFGAMMLAGALIAGRMAKERGRSPWGWALAGALTGLLAILLLAAMGSPRRCPFCRGQVHPMADVCPRCSRWISNAPERGGMLVDPATMTKNTRS